MHNSSIYTFVTGIFYSAALETLDAGANGPGQSIYERSVLGPFAHTGANGPGQSIYMCSYLGPFVQGAALP